jgi:hypothetical protein
MIGLLAWMTAVAGVFTPVFAIYPVWAALALSTIAGLMGGKVLPLLTLLTCLVNLFLLSPVSTALVGAGVYGLITTAILFLAAVGGLVLGWRMHAAKPDK